MRCLDEGNEIPSGVKSFFLSSRSNHQLAALGSIEIHQVPFIWSVWWFSHWALPRLVPRVAWVIDVTLKICIKNIRVLVLV